MTILVALSSVTAIALLVHPYLQPPTATPRAPSQQQHQHYSRHRASALKMQVVPPPQRPSTGASVSALSEQMRDMRAAMEQDEETAALMQALRGTNINDDDNAASGTTMQVVEMRRGDGADDQLPLTYDSERLAAYFAKRPVAVLTRVLQVASTSGAWVASVAFDAFKGQLTPGSKGEVEAVARLRSVLVSLGPFFIKLGQALSIRPDILSPQAMVQLQQLCDKVPPFDSSIAMATIREDLGCAAVSDIYSEITPEPVAAASLGQVRRLVHVSPCTPGRPTCASRLVPPAAHPPGLRFTRRRCARPGRRWP